MEALQLTGTICGITALVAVIFTWVMMFLQAGSLGDTELTGVLRCRTEDETDGVLIIRGGRLHRTMPRVAEVADDAKT